MKGCKKLLCLVLAVIMLVSLCPFAFANGLDNFQKIQTYRPGQYTDIAEGVWWTENIAAASVGTGLPDGPRSATGRP